MAFLQPLPTQSETAAIITNFFTTSYVTEYQTMGYDHQCVLSESSLKGVEER